MNFDDWLQLASTTSLALSGLLGVVIGFAKSPSRRARVYYITAFVMLTVIGITANVWSRQLEAGEKLIANENKEELSALAAEGESLMQRCTEQASLRPSAEAWAVKTETFLEKQFDEQYIRTFRSNVGLLPYSAPSACSQDNKAIWEALNNRVMRLQEFMR